MSTLGQYNSEIAKRLYRETNNKVESLIANGKIKGTNKELEFAKIISIKLKKVGAKVPQKFLDILNK